MTEQRFPSLPSLDTLASTARMCLDIYCNQAGGVFPLASILSYIIVECESMAASIALWHQQFSGAIISTAHGFVRILNEIMAYLVDMDLISELQPLIVPPVENNYPVANQFHEIPWLLQAPCFLYDSTIIAERAKPQSQSHPQVRSSRSVMHRLRSLIPQISKPYHVDRSTMAAYKKHCISSILAEWYAAGTADSAIDTIARHALVVLSTISASTCSANTVIFFTSTETKTKDIAMLLTPGPLLRKDIVFPNVQTVKVSGQIPPVDFADLAETCTFMEQSTYVGLFPRTRAVPRRVISPAHTGVLFPFIWAHEDLASWPRLAQNTNARSLQQPQNSTAIVEKYRRSVQLKKVESSKRKRHRKVEPYDMKKAMKDVSPHRLSGTVKSLLVRGAAASDVQNTPKQHTSNRGHLYCCRLSPAEYAAAEPFKARLPLLLTQPSKSHLSIRKDFTLCSQFSPEGQLYLLTVQLRFPNSLNGSMTAYLSKVVLHFSGAQGKVYQSEGSNPIPIPCVYEAYINQFIGNRAQSTEYGLYSLHTQSIEWRTPTSSDSNSRRCKGDVKPSVTLKVLYCNTDPADPVHHPTVDVSVDSTILPDVMYVTELVP